MTPSAASTGAGAATDPEKALPDKTRPASSHDTASPQRLAPSAQLTGHQAFYIFILDGIGGMAVSAGVNFAIAYAMYTTQDTAKHPIRLFQLPNTLAGDAAVTIIVQCILTWFVEMGLVAYDLGQRSIQPLGFVAEPEHRWLRRLFFLSPESPERSDGDSKVERARITGVSSLFEQALRGFLLAVVGFLLLWPVGVGALTALGDKTGGDYVYADRWTPQFFKMILGGVLGLLTTPLMAMFWLVRAGWEAGSGGGTAMHTEAGEAS